MISHDLLRTSLATCAATRELTIAAQTTHDVAVDYYTQSFGTITDVSIPRTALLQAKVAKATAYSDTLVAAASSRF